MAFTLLACVFCALAVATANPIPNIGLPQEQLFVAPVVSVVPVHQVVPAHTVVPVDPFSDMVNSILSSLFFSNLPGLQNNHEGIEQTHFFQNRIRNFV